MTKTTEVADHSRLRFGRGSEFQSWNWRTLGAAAGLGGGLATGGFGSLLTFGSWLMSGRIGQVEHSSGTILLLLMVPLLVLGAHCLDLTERHRDKVRRARYESYECRLTE